MKLWFRRIIKAIVGLVLLVVILDIAFVFGMAHYRRNIPKTDAVIILGAAINTPALYNRTLEGLHLYQQGKAGVLVLSGGKISSADISEAQYMEKVVKANSAQPVNYIIEDQSHTTYENIRNSKAKLEGKSSIVIVSDQFHLARAVLIAKREGFNHVYWSAPQPDYYNNGDLRYYYTRELVAMLAYLPKLIGG